MLHTLFETPIGIFTSGFVSGILFILGMLWLFNFLDRRLEAQIRREEQEEQRQRSQTNSHRPDREAPS
jgi:hypothetical protein